MTKLEMWSVAVLLLNRIEEVARDVDLGTAEDADVDYKAGAVVGAGEDVAFKAHELAAVDAHLFAAAERRESMVIWLSASLTIRIRLRI